MVESLAPLSGWSKIAAAVESVVLPSNEELTMEFRLTASFETAGDRPEATGRLAVALLMVSRGECGAV